VDVVFKGFAEQADSFGCVKYTAEDFQKKAIGGKGVTPSTEICGCCALDWTGSFSLTASNLEVREEHAQTLVLPAAHPRPPPEACGGCLSICLSGAGGHQCAA
jgi:hypothetical protein